ncbi:MAG: hypothetical protein WA941_03475 [Nitrososphaeraceae archaeon]
MRIVNKRKRKCHCPSSSSSSLFKGGYSARSENNQILDESLFNLDVQWSVT